jgi:hypothetical protein
VKRKKYMAQGLKTYQPEVAFSGKMVTPDEIDSYVVHTIINPLFGNADIGAGTSSGPAATATFTYGTALKALDYPRNLRTLWSTGTGTAVGGTVTIRGKDQFGSSITEAIVIVGTALATAEGTAIFAQITTVTAQQWTTAGDVSTVSVGGAILGTTAKFGLPVRIAGTSDVARIAWASNGTQVINNKGTHGAFVDASNHAIKALKTLEGTMGVSVWVMLQDYKSCRVDTAVIMR